MYSCTLGCCSLQLLCTSLLLSSPSSIHIVAGGHSPSVASATTALHWHLCLLSCLARPSSSSSSSAPKCKQLLQCTSPAACSAATVLPATLPPSSLRPPPASPPVSWAVLQYPTVVSPCTPVMVVASVVVRIPHTGCTLTPVDHSVVIPTSIAPLPKEPPVTFSATAFY